MATRRRQGALLFAAAALVAAVVVVLLGRGGGDGEPRRLAPGRGATATTKDPFAYDPARQQDFEQRAAAGLAHVLYDKSPGGVVATAQRTARFRPLVDQVAERGGVDPNTLEAIVFLESAGRPDARASNDLNSAVGLTQILAETGTSLLGLRVDVAAAERLTRRLARGGPTGRIRTLEARRRRVDERFDPRRALEGTVRYLKFAKDKLGRDDLAVASYHMGVGNLQRALNRYGETDIPYAQLFFDSTPLRHGPAWQFLASLGDDSSTYLWRIGAAKDIMSLYRKDPKKLGRMAVLQGAPSAEQVLQPPGTPRFADERALRTRDLVLVDGPGIRLSRALAAAPAGRRALREDALALLRYLSVGVYEVSKTGPLVITAAARAVKDESGFEHGIEAAPSMHTTGYAFDVSRRYRSGAQAQALQFWLDRLTALDVIAWAREPDRIHVTVGPHAADLPR